MMKIGKRLAAIVLAVAMVITFVPMFGMHTAYADETAGTITSLTINVTPPAAGEKSSEVRPQVTIGGENVSLESTIWLFDLNMYATAEPDVTFGEGETYYVMASIKANAGWYFEKGTTSYTGNDEGYRIFDGCTVTGATEEFAASKTFDGYDYLRVKFSVTPAASINSSIDSIEIGSLCVPQKGESPDSTSFTTNAGTAGYTINFVNWIDCDANQIVKPEDIFKGGTKYAFDIKITPLSSEYVLPENKQNVSVIVNGKSYTCDDSLEPGTALWWYDNEREWLRLRVYYKVPENVIIPTGKTLTYNGKSQTGVAAGTCYTLSGTASAANTGAYVATASLKYKEFDTWSDGTTEDKTISWKINKAANPLTVKAKTATVKYSNLKKKNQTLSVSKVITFTKKGQGKLTYTKASGNTKITINKTTGKVTVKKGLKKGTYKVKIKVKAAGNANYKASAWKTVSFKVKIK